MFFLIWGSKAEDREVSVGNFYCPNCDALAMFSKRRVERFFTVFFIPLFPTKTLLEYVRCRACHAEMNAGILQLSREQIRAMTQPWECPRCKNRNSAAERQCLACRQPRDMGPLPPERLRSIPRHASPPDDRFDY
jgi:hypothetical protein